jgi:hypothetical protein
MERLFPPQTNDVPHPFRQRQQADVIGVLSGFDRLRLSGTLRALYDPLVMQEYRKQTQWPETLNPLLGENNQVRRIRPCR